MAFMPTEATGRPKIMLQEVGKGYVMGNAFYRLSEALPDNEVIGTCDEDAEAKKLVELFL